MTFSNLDIVVIITFLILLCVFLPYAILTGDPAPEYVCRAGFMFDPVYKIQIIGVNGGGILCD